MENLQPKLRFPEFKDDWSNSEINNILNYVDYRGKTPEKVENGILLITAKNIKFGYIDYEVSKEYINPKDYNEVMRRGLPKKGDILITTEAPLGNVAQIDNENIALAQRVIKYSAKEKTIINNDFIKHIFLSDTFQKKLLEKASGSTALGIKGKELHKLNLSYPTLQEQTKIADFLGAVDKQLDILNQKKEKLNTYKKGVMQQLFAQQLRFKDDNGNNYPDWQEKTLGEIGNSFNGLTGKTAKDFGEGKKYIQYKQIFDKPYIDFNDCGFVNIIENEKQNECKIGDVFFTVSSETKEEIAMSSVIESSVDFPVYLNSFCFGIRFKENVLIPKFSRFYFRNEIFRKSVIVLAQGSTRFNLSKVNFMKLAITIPSIEEQTKIANFLSAIDKQIEAVENQITKTETYKKGLLQQMFV